MNAERYIGQCRLEIASYDLWREVIVIVIVAVEPDGNVICRLSGASWVSALICGRTRNPKTGGGCSQSWSAIRSTSPSPAGIPPPPTWNNQKTFFDRIVLPCIFETHAGVLHPHWQVISHVDLKKHRSCIQLLGKPCLSVELWLKLATKRPQSTGLGKVQGRAS